jgi:hypothetical protein
MARTSPFSMRLRPEIKDALQKLADADRRSLTNYIELVLEKHVEEATKGKGRRDKDK